MTDSSIPLPITLSPPGEREVVSKARSLEITKLWKDELQAHRLKVQAAQASSSLSHDVPLCDKIILTDKSYTAEAATEIASFLTSTEDFNPSVASGISIADISDVIASRHEDEGLAVLKTLSDAFSDSKLVEVDLSDNAMGSKGIVACASVLSGQAVEESLERLSLCNNGLSKASMSEVADLLTSQTGSSKTIAERLTKIHFYNNMSGDEGGVSFARILDKCTSKLQDVRFSGTRAGVKGSTAVAKALEKLGDNANLLNLTTLDLGDNTFGECVDEISAALRQCKMLMHLNLKDCVLEDDKMSSVCSALEDAGCPLVHLNMSGNEIPADTTLSVASLISRSKNTIESLSLEECEMTSIGVKHIATALKTTKIQEVNLECNECGRIGALSLVRVASSLPCLEKIKLDRNLFPQDSVEALKTAFMEKLDEMDENDDEEDVDEDYSDDDDDALEDLTDAVGKVTLNG